MSFTKLDYCQYLLSSQINYTLTNFANHTSNLSHDAINRYLKDEKITPRLLWQNVKAIVVPTAAAYILFDDTVIDKRYAKKIELSRRQYSGNAHGVIRGIGIVNCVYVNPSTQQFFVIDYRIYAPDSDGKTKLEHVADMLQNLVGHKRLPFTTVLMDSWYATKTLMQLIDGLGKYYYCVLKKNRLVDDTHGVDKYKSIEQLLWNEPDLKYGKLIKVKTFAQDKKVKLFRVIVSTDRTEYVVTNHITQNSTDDVQQVCAVRWKIEEFHRELKQVTGLEACQCRKERIQRNHIGCAMLVWLRLKYLAYQHGRTVYDIKRGLLSDYLIQQLKSPSIVMTLA